MEQNKLELEYASFSLHHIVEEAVSVIAFEAEKKKIELISDIEPDVNDIILGDACRLRQILINLLGNSVKFSFKGEIRVSVEVTAREQSKVTLLISVSDNGKNCRLTEY